MFGFITRCFLKEITSKVVERLLFLYAKLNPGQGYVQVILFFGGFHAVTSVQQGMNEIIGPIYYVMASDPRQVKNLYDNCDAAALQGLIIKWKIVLNDIECSWRIGRSTRRRTASSVSPTSCQTSGCFTAPPPCRIEQYFRDFFIKTLDDSASGIQAIMARLADRSQKNFLLSLKTLQIWTLRHQVERGRSGLCWYSERTGAEHLPTTLLQD